MVIIADKNKENIVYIPKNIEGYSSAYDLILKNRGTNVNYEFKGLVDEHYVTYGFYSFIINFSDVPQDEYEYELVNDNFNTVAKGIIRIQSLVTNTTYYNNEQEYEYYDGQTTD